MNLCRSLFSHSWHVIFDIYTFATRHVYKHSRQSNNFLVVSSYLNHTFTSAICWLVMGWYTPSTYFWYIFKTGRACKPMPCIVICKGISLVFNCGNYEEDRSAPGTTVSMISPLDNHHLFTIHSYIIRNDFISEANSE